MIRFIDYFRKMINDVLFKELKEIMPFNKVHLWTIMIIIAIIGICLVKYYFFQKDNKKRKFFLFFSSFLLLVIVLFNTIYIDIICNNIIHIRNTSINFVHLLYSLIPLSITSISIIFIFIILYKKKRNVIIDGFTGIITPLYGIFRILFFDRNTIFKDEFFIYFLINLLLILIPCLLILLKVIKINWKSLFSGLSTLFFVQAISFTLSMFFNIIGKHSLTFIRPNGVGTYYYFNYNQAYSNYGTYIQTNLTKQINNTNLFYKLLESCNILPIAFYGCFLMTLLILLMIFKTNTVTSIIKKPLKLSI